MKLNFNYWIITVCWFFHICFLTKTHRLASVCENYTDLDTKQIQLLGWVLWALKTEWESQKAKWKYIKSESRKLEDLFWTLFLLIYDRCLIFSLKIKYKPPNKILSPCEIDHSLIWSSHAKWKRVGQLIKHPFREKYGENKTTGSELDWGTGQARKFWINIWIEGSEAEIEDTEDRDSKQGLYSFNLFMSLHKFALWVQWIHEFA